MLPVDVSLPDGDARVVMSLAPSRFRGEHIVQGLARYTDGRTVGEQHIDMGVRPHVHDYEMGVACMDFALATGRGIEPGPVAVATGWRRSALNLYVVGAALGLIVALRVVPHENDLMHPLAWDASLQLADELNGASGRQLLFADPALQQALVNRLAQG